MRVSLATLGGVSMMSRSGGLKDMALGGRIISEADWATAVPEPMAIPISAFKSFTFILAADKTTLKQCRFYQQIAQEK